MHNAACEWGWAAVSEQPITRFKITIAIINFTIPLNW